MRPRATDRMRYDPDQYHRHSIRLSRHDYAGPGAYFLTLVTSGRECLFGQIADREMCLNALGEIVVEEWKRTDEVRPNVEIDTFVVMPNHTHVVVIVGAHSRAPEDECTLSDSHARQRDRTAVLGDPSNTDDAVARAHACAPLRPPDPSRRPRSIGSLVAGFKAAATKRINESRGSPGAPVWQRNYYEHVIRDDEDLDRIRRYVAENPLRWKEDPENVL